MDDKEYQRKMEEHNQEVQARMSGRNHLRDTRVGRSNYNAK